MAFHIRLKPVKLKANKFVLLLTVIYLICTTWQTALASISFAKQPSSTIISEGSNVILHCSVNDILDEIITFLWKYQEKFINTASSGHYQIHSNGSLSITNITQSIGSGQYECVASSDIRGIIISNPAKLQIAYLSIPSDIYQRKNASRAEGTPLFVKAPRVSSVPPAQFFWQIVKQGSRQDVTSYPRFFVSSTGNILISPIKRDEDNALLQLYVWNSIYNPYQSYLLMEVYLTINGTMTRGSCPQPEIVFYPTQPVVNALEGQTNVGLECLAAAKRCWSEALISWSRNGRLVSKRNRNLIYTEIELGHQGRYKCTASVNSGQQREAQYQINVKAKPQFTTNPQPHYTILQDNPVIIRAGQVTNAEQLRWYTKGEKIQSFREYYKILSDNNLQIKKFSRAMSGLYQIFFENDAGIVNFTIVVEIQAGCGSQLIGSRGNITYINETSNKQPDTILTCSWVLQVPFPQRTTLYIDKFTFTVGDCLYTMLEIFQASPGAIRASNRKVQVCHDQLKPDGKPITLTSHFITIKFRVKVKYLASGGFSLSFGPYVPTTTSIPTTIPTTTRRTSIASTGKSFSYKSTFSLPSTVWTTASSAKTSSSPIPVVKPAPDKIDNKDNSGIIFGAVGGAIGVLSILIIAIGIFCFRKKRHSAPASKISKPNTTQNRTDRLNMFQSSAKKYSPSSSPFLDFAGPGHVDTQFTVKVRETPSQKLCSGHVTNKNLASGPDRYDLGYVGPGTSADEEIYDTAYDSIENVGLSEKETGKNEPVHYYSPTSDESRSKKAKEPGHYYSPTPDESRSKKAEEPGHYYSPTPDESRSKKAKEPGHYYSCAKNGVGNPVGQDDMPGNHYYSSTHLGGTHDETTNKLGPRAFPETKHPPTALQQSVHGDKPIRPGSNTNSNKSAFPAPRPRPNTPLTGMSSDGYLVPVTTTNYQHPPLTGTTSDGYLVPVIHRNPSETNVGADPRLNGQLVPDQPIQEPLYHVVENDEDQHNYQPVEAGEPSRYLQNHQTPPGEDNHDGGMYYEPMDVMPKSNASESPASSWRYVTMKDKASNENPLYEPLDPTYESSDKTDCNYQTLSRQAGSQSGANYEGVKAVLKARTSSEKENEAYEAVGERRQSQKESQDYQSLTMQRKTSDTNLYLVLK